MFLEAFFERSAGLSDIKAVSYTHLDVYKRQSLHVTSWITIITTSILTPFKPLHICKNGRYMDTLEEFEIYKAFKQSKKTNNSQDGGFILNDQLNFKSNPLYDTAIGIQDALHR